MTIKLADVSGVPDSVQFTGSDAIVNTPDNEDTKDIDEEDILIRDADNDEETTKEWKVQVPGGTRIGNVRVTVVHSQYGDPLIKTVTIGTNDLEVSPSSVVPRQTISIDGGGFTKSGRVNLKDVTIDSKPVLGEGAEDKFELINNNGDISFEITVPESVTAGSGKVVKVVDNNERVGTATITVAKAEISLSPTESLRGETITVSGTGFPANDLVLIKYNDATVDTSQTGPTGTFEQDVEVPASGNINPGGTYPVEAESQVNTPAVSDDEKHKILDAEITLTPNTAAAGSHITISGKNFKGFLQVYKIEIGGQNVTPVPAPSTDVWGAFTAENIQVPQLTTTRHAVKVTVEDAEGDSATEFLSVVAETVAPPSTVPAERFAELIDAGTLSTVWHLDASTQSWTSFSTNPALADFNDLTVITGGQVYVLIMSAAGEFQGKPLFAGTNQVFIP